MSGPGRKVVPMALNKHHFTKEERERRLKAEAKLKGGADKVKPPKWLDKEAAAEFRRLAKALLAIDFIGNTDVGGLAIACDAYSKYIMATQAINKGTIDAQITKSSNETVIRKTPLTAVEKYANIYCKYCHEYGLTPSSRIKLSAALAAVKDEDEPTGMAAFLAARGRAGNGTG